MITMYLSGDGIAYSCAIEPAISASFIDSNVWKYAEEAFAVLPDRASVYRIELNGLWNNVTPLRLEITSEPHLNLGCDRLLVEPDVIEVVHPIEFHVVQSCIPIKDDDKPNGLGQEFDLLHVGRSYGAVSGSSRRYVVGSPEWLRWWSLNR